jgi:uncharacterized protein YcgI (DUF1989 family)
MSTTATPHGARDHARSLGGTVTRFQPTVPARDAADLPDGVPAEQVVWEETLGPGGYAARRLPVGTVIRLTDVDGDACANVLAYNALRPVERLNVADTVKVFGLPSKNLVQNFTLTINQAPAIINSEHTSFDVTQAGSFTLAVSGFPNPVLSTQGALPPLNNASVARPRFLKVLKSGSSKLSLSGFRKS